MKFFQHTGARDFTRRSLTEGFTLVEVLVTIAIYGLIMGAVVGVLLLIIGGSQQKLASLSSVDQVGYAGARFGNEIRDAQEGNDGSYAIAEASSTEIIFFSAYGATPPAIDRIRYYVANNTLYRGVTIPSGSPLAYDLSAEVVTPIVNDVVNSTTSAFNYYDGTYAGTSSPLVQPVNLTQITYVAMDLQVLIQDVRNATTTYAFTVGSAVRSLKTNLGN